MVLGTSVFPLSETGVLGDFCETIVYTVIVILKIFQRNKEKL